MTMTDPVADMLSRLRNASLIRRDRVDVPASKLKAGIARILKQEGFIRNYRVIEDHKQGILRIYLKYGPDREEAFGSIARVSRPGSRVWMGVKEIPRLRGGAGISIVSTSRGLLTDEEARKQGLGGEVLCRVW